MFIIPAIDLYKGNVVRLYHGDYDEMKIYSDSPEETARQIQKEGAEWLHLVDLEGARDGTTPNLHVIERIASESRLRIEIGGGIRSIDTIDKYLSAGISRVILGTRAVTDEDFLRDALKRYGQKIAVGVDVRDGFIAIRGWRETVDLDVFSYICHLRDLGVNCVIVTDISRDGAMAGTNLPLYEKLQTITDLNVTASGGVSSYEDIRQLKKIGVYGAIIGKALYEHTITLGEALQITGK